MHANERQVNKHRFQAHERKSPSHSKTEKNNMKCGITCKPTQQRKATEKKNSIAELKVRCGLKKIMLFRLHKTDWEGNAILAHTYTHTDIHTTVQTQITVNNNGAVIVLSTKYKRSITFIFGFYGEICIIINLVVRCRLVGCRTLSYSIDQPTYYKYKHYRPILKLFQYRCIYQREFRCHRKVIKFYWHHRWKQFVYNILVLSLVKYAFENCALRHITLFNMNNKMNIASFEKLNEHTGTYVRVRQKSIFSFRYGFEYNVRFLLCF